MQNWVEDDRFGECQADRDRADAVRVCARLDMPFHARNFAAEYWDRVFDTFLNEYRAGRTPNPDVLCNREIKFRTFLDHARALGAGRIATGHYARTDAVDGRHRLLRGHDANKDQSYFLYTLGQEQLAATLFPVGELAKPEVRRIAAEAGLPTHAKKDSTGICFIGERDFREFLGRYIPARPGEIRTPEGTLIGEHGGAMYYTLGQRDGLRIGGRREQRVPNRGMWSARKSRPTCCTWPRASTTAGCIRRRSWPATCRGSPARRRTVNSPAPPRPAIGNRISNAGCGSPASAARCASTCPSGPSRRDSRSSSTAAKNASAEASSTPPMRHSAGFPERLVCNNAASGRSLR